jgi:hypothetical protein
VLLSPSTGDPRTKSACSITSWRIRAKNPLEKDAISRLTKIARLGGYLARANDPPPRNTFMWRGLSRLTDIELALPSG